MSSCTGIRIGKKRTVFFALLVSFLFFYYHLFEVSVLFYLALVGLLISVFVLSDKEMFLMISFLIPNLFMFKQLGSETALLGFFFVLVSIKEIILNFKRIARIDLFLLLHIAFVLLTCILNEDRSLLNSLVRFVFNFSLFSYYATLFSPNGEIKQVVKMYFAGIITAVLMGIVFQSVRSNLYNGYFGGVNSGRNFFGAVISPTVTIAMLYFLEKRISLLETILYAATMILCIISIVLSHSRTSVLSLAIPFFMCLHCVVRSFWKFNKKFIPLLLLISIIGLIVYVNYHDAIFSLLARFGEDDVQTGNDRFVLWKYYIGQTFRNPVSFLFGSGSAVVHYAVEHNTFIQCFYQLGAISTVTLLGFIQQTFRRITQRNKIRLTASFPLLSVIFPYCGISALYSDQLSYLLVLSALIMKDFSKTKAVNKLNRNFE